MTYAATGWHSVFVMHVHLVFVTKFRHNVFTDDHLVRMEEIMRSVCADFECELVEFNGEDNHVHLLVNFPPKVAVTKLVNSLKGVSDEDLWNRPGSLFPSYCWILKHVGRRGAKSRCEDPAAEGRRVLAIGEGQAEGPARSSGCGDGFTVSSAAG
ncbi:IS200/IS605 family transposase [Streptomyces sp. NBC_00589]|nr:IS200/IS605 family transposase [Streptomyces sp. NBC_00589]WTI42265.1 IS200/IS605 family transposase [Streptomyces sp. NBC_00775]WUB24053.1 IS200/IS605 family transposase [Streptomyces sp. NBC_00589]